MAQQTISDIALSAIDSMAKSIAAITFLRNELVRKDDEVRSRDMIISQLKDKIVEMECKLDHSNANLGIGNV